MSLNDENRAAALAKWETLPLDVREVVDTLLYAVHLQQYGGDWGHTVEGAKVLLAEALMRLVRPTEETNP